MVLALMLKEWNVILKKIHYGGIFNEKGKDKDR